MGDTATNIKKEHEIHALPIEFYKVYDILSSFIDIIASQSPLIVLFVRKKNKYKLKRIVLLQNMDIDFQFNSFYIHYSAKNETFDLIVDLNKRENGNDDDNRVQYIEMCKGLL